MTRQEILKRETYHLTLIQAEMYALVARHMESTGATLEDVCEKTDQSPRIIRSVLNGSCRLSLSTLLDICLKLGYAPKINFVEIEKYDE